MLQAFPTKVFLKYRSSFSVAAQDDETVQNHHPICQDTDPAYVENQTEFEGVEGQASQKLPGLAPKLPFVLDMNLNIQEKKLNNAHDIPVERTDYIVGL